MSDAPTATPAPLEARETPGPTGAADRIDALDILRGFALFGVLLVNLEFWFRTSQYRYHLNRFPYPSLPDRIVDAILPVFFEVRFLSLFSFLFGAGLAIQLERAERSQARPLRFLARRLGVLLGIGAAHIFLIWSGDILHVYAVVGLFVLPLLRRRPKTLAIVAACIIALPAVGNLVVRLVQLARGRSAVQARDTASLAETRALIEENVRVFGQGSWLEIARARIDDYVRFAPDLAFVATLAFVMALLGVVAWKRGVFQRPADHRPLLRRTLALGLIFGIGFSIARVARVALALPEVPLWVWRSMEGFFPAAMIASTLAYGALILLALERERSRAILAHLAPVGRMALSNYLLQSVICSLLFYGFGLGLYDKLGSAAGALLAVAIFAAQIELSRAWFTRFQFGPVEWLWRSLTYGRSQPMRKTIKTIKNPAPSA
ncbi:MAG TPA: DUF418 domain-containing protein [Polyangiaceae bacterium]|jgi:uncharacterized protein|nr:DUF418 domain-containing protein [Polyangiaceae bacterium]